MSKTTKYTIATMAGVLALALVFYYQVQQYTKPAPTEITQSEEKSPLTTNTQRGPQATLPPNLPPRKTQIAWTKLDKIDPAEWPNAPSQATFVRFNDRFDEWLLGSPVEIHIPPIGKTYDAIVDRITPNGLDSTTIRASPTLQEPELQRLVLTFSAKQTLAYVSTNQGSWELQGNDHTGWLVSTTSLKRAQDYSKSDVIRPIRDRYADAEYVPRREE